MTEARTLPEFQPEDFDQYDGEVIEPQRPFGVDAAPNMIEQRRQIRWPGRQIR